jgi:hypothetical protein
VRTITNHHHYYQKGTTMKDRKFFITTLTVRVLAEDEPWGGDLQWLSHDVTEGDYVGDIADESTVEVSDAEMAEALTAAGSDPGFFWIDDEGDQG